MSDDPAFSSVILLNKTLSCILTKLMFKPLTAPDELLSHHYIRGLFSLKITLWARSKINPGSTFATEDISVIQGCLAIYICASTLIW